MSWSKFERTRLISGKFGLLWTHIGPMVRAKNMLCHIVDKLGLAIAQVDQTSECNSLVGRANVCKMRLDVKHVLVGQLDRGRTKPTAVQHDFNL